jgi:hypothetical protein
MTAVNAVAPAGAQESVAQRIRLDEPVIVLTCARAGSTLLRFVLDSHPDFACPPETNIANLISRNVATWKMLLGRGELEADDTATIRSAVDRLMSAYLLRRGRRRWCDKSLGTAEAAATILEVYPQTQFVCLYRHCMDVVASAVEACPWGVAGYGFEPYVYNSPGNNIAALAHYWADHTTAILEFEESHKDRCHRVYYEDLATFPEATAKEMFSFLGAVDRAEIPGTRLVKPDDVSGPSDYKIWGTNQITSDSVGRGVTVPAGLMPSPLLSVVNALLERLNYAQIGNNWNQTAGSQILLNSLHAGNGGAKDYLAGEDSAQTSGLETMLIRRIRQRLDNDPQQLLPEASGTRPSGVLIIVKPDRRSAAASTWRVDYSSGRLTRGKPGATDSDWVLTADQDSWHAVLAGELNVGVALRQGRIHCAAEFGDDAARGLDPASLVADLLGIGPRTRDTLEVPGREP